VSVRIKEAVPEPVFTLPAGLVWNGRDAMIFRPSISNLPAIKASRDTAIHWAWTVSGLEADTAWVKDGLNLRSTAAEGTLMVGLCLDNSGPAACQTASITVSRIAGSSSSVLARPASARPAQAQDRAFRDASGRLRSGSPSRLFGTTARPAP
jgi:hypothetical protein